VGKRLNPNNDNILRRNNCAKVVRYSKAAAARRRAVATEFRSRLKSEVLTNGKHLARHGSSDRAGRVVMDGTKRR